MSTFNLLDELARHLEFLGLGKMSDEASVGDIYYGRMPDTPDTCICVFSTDSQYCGSQEGARIQIYVRAKSSKTAYELSQRIADELIDFDGFLAGDGAHVCITLINASVGLGTDSKNREMYSSNYSIQYCDC